MQSMLGGGSSMMGTPSFGELKKQASFFFKEKIKTARLALTDVTPAQLLAEEVTGETQWGPDTKTMRLISKAAFEVDDYCRIVRILHNRLSKFDKHNWRVSYNSLILLEHLLTHGPASAAEEFQIDTNVISDMESFQYTDDKGFNWGLLVRKKAERVLSLLENCPLLKQERLRARKVTRGIQGFGSFSDRHPDHGIMLKQSSSFGAVFRMSSDNHLLENSNSSSLENNGHHVSQQKQGESQRLDCFGQVRLHGTCWETETCSKENTVLGFKDVSSKFRNMKCTGESTEPLLDEPTGKPEAGISITYEEDHYHPFIHHVQTQAASASLRSTKYC